MSRIFHPPVLNLELYRKIFQIIILFTQSQIWKLGNQYCHLIILDADFHTRKKLDTLKGRLENFPDPTPNHCVSSFHNYISIFQLTGNQIFPVTKLSCKDRKRYKHPWITAGIFKSCENRFFLLKRSLELKIPESRQIYTRFRNKYVHTS